MSTASAGLRHPSGCACGCCGGSGGLPGATPVDETNPPGQPALSVRVGTHGRFLASQLLALDEQAALRTLTARSSDDGGIALLDAWSSLLDVLSFYQERIVNEGYLRTATERQSILQLARSIGYELRPGVAASTWLAFSLDTAPGAPLAATVPVGTRAQSVPAQNETAQVFEAIEAIDARSAWNAMPVVRDEPIVPLKGQTTLYLRGQSNRLQVGDMLLIVGDERLADSGSERWDARRIVRLLLVPPAEPSADPLAGTTVVTLDEGLGSRLPPVHPAGSHPRCYVLRTKAALFGAGAPDWKAMPAALRASYQGIDDPAQAKISEQAEWPGFSLSGLSGAPGSAGAGTGTGLLGEYFVGKQFNQVALRRTDPTVSFGWGTGSPGGTLPADNFSARWTGWIEIPHRGDYTFFLTIDDGARLWIGGRLLIDKWFDNDSVEYASAPVALEAGRSDIRIEYFEHAISAAIDFAWQGPGIAKATVPAARLYPRDVYDVCLDASYPKFVLGSWVLLEIPGYRELYRVQQTAEGARTSFTLSAKSTRLTLQGEHLPELYDQNLRDTAVFGESNELAWATRPLSGLMGGTWLDLATLESDLAAGRWIAVSGSVLADVAANSAGRTRLQRGDALAALELSKDGLSATATFTDGDRHLLQLAAASEVIQVRAPQLVGGRTRLLFETPLQHAYLPLTASVNANVAAATHGDNRQMAVQPEVLGSGDGASVFQRFVLQQPPLTYVSASTASGAQSTLTVSVEGIAWREAATMSELGPTDRAYLLRQADDGTTSVCFGDGAHGARLPSGSFNVSARYRVGAGAAGNMPDHRISVLLSSVLGVRSVSQPVAATGGVDAEAGERARRNAPLTVLTLDRIVSLRDFEDFAAAYTGVGKAQAVSLWNGSRRVMHLTVSGVNGVDIDPQSSLFSKLQAAIDSARPAHQLMTLAKGRVLRFGLVANVRIDPAYDARRVLPAIRAALDAAFGFDARSFGQSLSGSELVAVMQRVPGVDWIDLDTLSCTDGGVTTTANGPDGRLRAWGARWTGSAIAPGELLLLDPLAVTLTELSP